LMQVLLSSVAEYGTTVLLSSHALSDLDVACDYLILLSKAEVVLADDLEHIRLDHRLLVGVRRPLSDVPAGAVVVSSTETERQSTWLIRSETPVSEPSFEVAEPTLEEIVLGYLRSPVAGRPDEALAPGTEDEAEKAEGVEVR
ncbi:MAG TPA: hypothetical protein VEH29_05870, partial [Acidimicrobiales bacterium]|nr:hypothetical protein [Acidimicrobiales bacterium]